MSKAADLSGKQFGRWFVLGPADPLRDRQGNLMWRCRCSCGTERAVRGYVLTSRDCPSCGCRIVEATKLRAITHGKRSTKEYGIYRAMLNRCDLPSQKCYPQYGGRGITVCERWRASFAAFLEDMGPRPSDGHSVDRIDPNGNYEPGNCRWATSVQQNNNRRNNRRITHAGKTLTLAEWARELGVPLKRLWAWLKRGRTLAQVEEVVR